VHRLSEWQQNALATGAGIIQ